MQPCSDDKHVKGNVKRETGMRIGSDPVIFGLPDPILFSTDPDPDPDHTYNNGFIKLFLYLTKYKSESTNSSIK